MPILNKIGKPPLTSRTVDAACAVKLISSLDRHVQMLRLWRKACAIGKLAGTAWMAMSCWILLLDTGCASFQMKTRGPWMEAGDLQRARFGIDIAACEDFAAWLR